MGGRERERERGKEGERVCVREGGREGVREISVHMCVHRNIMKVHYFLMQ